jgi:hypothetical protein
MKEENLEKAQNIISEIRRLRDRMALLNKSTVQILNGSNVIYTVSQDAGVDLSVLTRKYVSDIIQILCERINKLKNELDKL